MRLYKEGKKQLAVSSLLKIILYFERSIHLGGAILPSCIGTRTKYAISNLQKFIKYVQLRGKYECKCLPKYLWIFMCK